MKLRRFNDPQEFYARVKSYLLTYEAENNLPLGLAGALAEDPNRYGDDPPYMATVEQDGEIELMALRTPPRNLVLPMTARVDGIAVIVQDVYETYGTIPGVNAPSAVSKAFADRWRQLTGQFYRPGYAMRIFRLGRVAPVTGVGGRLRRIVERDRPVIVEWFKAFNHEAVGTEIDTVQAERSFAQQLDAAGACGLYVWDDGEAVSMAGATRPTLNGISIGPVYTPPEKRRKGYASACVAALSQLLLDGGYKFCSLYTDLANPTSNHIYQAIGYRPICDAQEYLFSE
ncbi:MAG: GNAT family N-acetyltransferase [Anaerolineae bacterium]|nr:GNAT family N-acetyltransferase [Anaerolineae bacterium]